MSVEEQDPLLDKLRTLPVHRVETSRGEKTLRAAEAGLSPSVRPGNPWAQWALGIALSVAGFMYTVDSVAKIHHIFVANEVASLER
jgi:hypothetical protein